MADVRLSSINKDFSGIPIIRAVDVDITDGEFVVIVGPSGCGKSTLLRIIAGLEDPSSGDVFIDRENVTNLAPAKRGVAMVFQSYALYPHMNVFKNIAFGLEVLRLSKAEIEERVINAAKVLQLDAFLDRKPGELSGGQRQRVAIGRAIVRDPNVFLFDEPLSNLDASLRVKMRLELAKLHRDLNATTIYVTHDQVEAMTLADKIVVLRDGAVEQVGTPMSLYESPKNRFVASFIGSPAMNFVDVTAIGISEHGMKVELPGGEQLVVPVSASFQREGDKLTLGVRPEHFLEESTQQNCIEVKGKIFAIERLGGETFLYVDIGASDPLIVQSVGNSRARMGDQIVIALVGDDCHLFDAEDNALPRVTA